MSIVLSAFRRPLAISIVLFASCLVYYVSAALKFPDLFNIDSQYNHAATSYLSEHKKIPIVNAKTEGVLFTDLGTTRSLRPPFTFIVSALISDTVRSFGILTEDRHLSQRLGSSLIGALTVTLVFLGFYLAFKHLGLALFGALALGLLPKFVLLASCNNDDIGAIFSASALFISTLALKEYGSKPFVLFLLAVSVGLIFQSKYTAWLVLPILGFYCLNYLRSDFKKVIKLGPILLLAVILAGGWWPIFNMVNYGVTDPAALNHAAKLQQSLVNIQPNQNGYLSSGVSALQLLGNHDEFLFKSVKSFIGYLDWIELEVGWQTYFFYGLIFFVGIVASIKQGIARTRNGLQQFMSFEIACCCLIIFQSVFYLHHNLVRDIQPQARYILPVVVPMLYLFLSFLAAVPRSTIVLAFGYKSYQFHTLAATSFAVACLFLNLNVIANHLVPSYSQRAFHTALNRSQTLPVVDFIRGSSATALDYSVQGLMLEIKRSDKGMASLLLDKSICKKLSSLALITMDTNSLTAGGLYFRVDRNHKQSFEHLYWGHVIAGKGRARFVISTENCTGLKITLSKNLHRIAIRNIQVSELRVNRHGKPI